MRDLGARWSGQLQAWTFGQKVLPRVRDYVDAHNAALGARPAHKMTADEFERIFQGGMRQVELWAAGLKGDAPTHPRYRVQFEEAFARLKAWLKLPDLQATDEWRARELHARLTGGREGAQPTAENAETSAAEAEAKSRQVQQERAKKQAARMAIDPEADDLLAAIAKAGGLSRVEAEQQGIDPAHFAKRGTGIYRVFTKAGESFDGMAERLSQYGYPVIEADGRYSANALLASLAEALDGGRRVISSQGAAAEGERMAAQRVEPDPLVDWVGFDDWSDAVQPEPDRERAAALRNVGVAALGEDAFDDLVERVAARTEGASDAEYLDALEEAINATRNHAEGQDGLGAGAEVEPGEGFELGQQTPADVERQERERRQREEAEAEARRRAEVDAQREYFVLTGSNRAADELAGERAVGSE
jgi:hypothetical protein